MLASLIQFISDCFGSAMEFIFARNNTSSTTVEKDPHHVDSGDVQRVTHDINVSHPTREQLHEAAAKRLKARKESDA